MLTSTFSPYVSHRNTPLFQGKGKKAAPEEDSYSPSETLSPPADLLIEAPQQPNLLENKESSTLLEKMFSGWNLRGQASEKPLGKKVSFEDHNEGLPESSAAGQSAQSDWKSSLAKLHIPGLRKTVPPGTRVKKKNPRSTVPPSSVNESGSPLAKTRSHGQEAPQKTLLAPIHENDADSILQRSIPNVGAPLDQLLKLPPQLPAALNDLTEFADKTSKTPASSLWVEGTTGQASRVSSSYPPSRNQELPADDAEDYSDADTESLQSDTSSAFLVDDVPEVLQEREERATKKWAKAVKNQQLGSLIAQQIIKPDIHQNSRYLEGDSDLESEDQALYYDSEDGLSDSDNESVRSVKHQPQAKPESLLTKTVLDPKFNLVTQHQKMTQESNTKIKNAVTTEALVHDEQRIHDLQQNYSPEQLAVNYRKLGIRLSHIQARKQQFREQLNIPPGMTMAEKAEIWHSVLSNLKLETTQQLESLASAAQKGKLTESNASSQWKALMAKRQKVELKQQQADSAVGIYNDLEANEDQIRTRLALYHEATARNRHQSLMNLLEQASTNGKSDQEKLQHMQELGHRYPSAELKQLKTEIRSQHHTNPTPQLQVLDRALKYQDAMVSNIVSRLKNGTHDASRQKTLAQELSRDFSPVELQEAYHQLPVHKELHQPDSRSILRLSLKMRSEQ